MKKFSLSLLFVLCVAGAMASAPWKASWISHETSQSLPNQWLCLRTTVQLNAIPASAPARIAADSKYWLWINGRPVVFEGGLKRGPAPGAHYYDEVDIAPYLQPGENTIAALVWYFGKNGFSHANSGRAGFLFDCQAPGVTILSDQTWKCITYEAYRTAGEPYPNYRLSESSLLFDSRKAIDAWEQPGPDRVKGDAMKVGDPGQPPFGPLVKRPIPMWKDSGLKEYVSVERVGDTLLCQLPYNAQVTPWFKVRSERGGETIEMHTDSYRSGLDIYSVRAEYITRPGEQSYESLGWMSGHVMRYAIPAGVEVLEVKYRETGYATEFAGGFSSSDPFMNELWKRAARTLYINMRDNYFDCPERERAQWWGDAVIELEEVVYAFDPAAQQLTRKAILELMNWQREDGVVYAPVPAGNWTRELPLQSLASVGWYGFYNYYLYSGDESFIPLIYDKLHRYLHEVWQMDPQGLVASRPGDWTWGDWGEEQDMEVMTNCWYYLALKAEREFARILGKTGDVAQITARMEGMERAFDTRFWTGTAYRDPAYTGATDDRSQALAVLSGLASADKYPALSRVLGEEYHASPYMEKYVLESLFQMGFPAQALERIRRRYGEMMSSQYTTLYEVWSFRSTPDDANTYNHGWTGGPLTLLSQRVCGIQPTSPGFKTFRIAPQPGSLTRAEATVSSVCGEIRAAFVRQGRNLTVTATVPVGTRCEVVFPGGKTVALEPGAHTLKGK